MTHRQGGRSMIEVLAVLSIIGVLSVISIIATQALFNKYKANQITKAIGFAEQEIARILNSDTPVGTQKLNTQEFGWDQVAFDDCLDGTIDVAVSGIPQKVCQNLVATWRGRRDISINVMPHLETSLVGLTCQKNVDEYESQCTEGLNEFVLTFYVENLVPGKTTQEAETTDECQSDEDCATGCTETDCPTYTCHNGKCTDTSGFEKCNKHGAYVEDACVCDPGYSGTTCECEGTICGSICCETGKKCVYEYGSYKCTNNTTCAENEILYNGKCCPPVGTGNACSYTEDGADGCPVLKNRCSTGKICIPNKSEDCSKDTTCCQNCSDTDAFPSTIEECDACPNTRFWSNGICYSCKEQANIPHTSFQQCNKCWVRFFTGRNTLDGICYKNDEICDVPDRIDTMTQQQCRNCHRVWGKVDKEEKCFNCLDNFFIWTTKADCNLCPKRFYTEGRCYLSFETACQLAAFPSTEGVCRACGEGRRFWVHGQGNSGTCYPCSRQLDIPSTEAECKACKNRVHADDKCKLVAQ